MRRAVLAGALSALPTIAGALADEPLLTRLYRLIRPGASQGQHDKKQSQQNKRLSDFLARATQRGAPTESLTRILLIDVRTGARFEWVRGRGATEPVICPDRRTLVVRRGNTAVTSTIDLATPGAPKFTEPTPVADLVVRQIFACTHSAARNAGPDLWIERDTGDVATVSLLTTPRIEGPVPEALRAEWSDNSGPALRRFQGLRADGLAAVALDGRLVLEREVDGHVESRILAIDMPVAGDPAWLGDSDWLVVTGLKD